ncbi:MAG: UbiA-like protein EboC, partial [Bacteroidetes bacterium]|nr:UbiA-like protein EboC [Bacteroidota bacterium]
AWQVSAFSGVLALTIALLALLYDAWGKHTKYFGPINMGLCRGANLLLGVSALPAMLPELWYIGLIPIIYIAAITMISRGEVHGGNRLALQAGLFIYAIVIVTIITLSFFTAAAWWQVVPFVALFAYLIFPPLIEALHKQDPKFIGKAVKAGVISLIVLNAALATAFAGWQWGLIILLLLPLSRWLARSFAVT